MPLRALLGIVLGIVARAWLWTLRVELEIHPALDEAAVQGRAWVLSFFHGTQWPLLAWRRRRPTLVMVSHSRDGQIQARALGLLGFLVVRGSSSRGGARGLATIVRGLKQTTRDAAFAVDGPRGPYGAAKAGALVAARRSGGVVVPMGSAIGAGLTFERAWDRFALPWPFTRVAVVLGAPFDLSVDETGEEARRLSLAIRDANDRARSILAGASPGMVALPGFPGGPPPARERH